MEEAMISSPSSSSMIISHEDDQNDVVHKQMQEEKRFLEEWKSLGSDPYIYREEFIRDESDGHSFFLSSPTQFRRVQNLGTPFIKAINLGNVKHYAYSELETITRDFNQTNLIMQMRYGRLFRGKINDQDVIVKTWDFSFKNRYTNWCRLNTYRIIDELELLRDPRIKSHPSAPNLIGFHCDYYLAVVYDGVTFLPEYNLNDILPSAEFGWEDRMKVAIEMGSMLKFFLDNNLVHGGVHADSVILDKRFCFKINQFRVYCYHEEFERLCLPYGFISPVGDVYKGLPEWSMVDDIFMYGILLMELITKDTHHKYHSTYKWLMKWIRDPPKSVVDTSLDVDEETACKVTKLAFDCLKVRKNIDQNVEVVVVDIANVVQDLKTFLDTSITRAAKRQKLCE